MSASPVLIRCIGHDSVPSGRWHVGLCGHRIDREVDHSSRDGFNYVPCQECAFGGDTASLHDKARSRTLDDAVYRHNLTHFDADGSLVPCCDHDIALWNTADGTGAE